MLIQFTVPLCFNSHIKMYGIEPFHPGVPLNLITNSHVGGQPIVSSPITVYCTNQQMSFISRNVWINSSLGNGDINSYKL
jgi:hypothetical protein